MKKSSITLKTEKELQSLKKSQKTKPYFPSDYIVGKSQCQLKFINLTAPVIRKYFKNTDLSWNDVHKIWNESNYFEAKSICLYWLDNQSSDFLIKNHKKIISWSKTIDNWAHADGYSSVLARLFEKNPFLLIETYKNWNSHKNTWYRRLSLVGLFYYSRQRESQPPLHLVQKFILNNINQEDYYLQKAVGWTIREMYNAYPQEGFQFISTYVQEIHPHAWYAASEKLSLKSKKALLAQRKKTSAR